MLFVWLASAVVLPLTAQSWPVNFESYPDSFVLTSQYAGATFANTIVVTAGMTLNEFEFPPHSGGSVASDSGGPITVVFAAPVLGFHGYFTYSVPLTLQALDASNQVLATATSAFSNNQALSGVSGSHPNELLSVSSATAIYKIVITGSAQGASFTLDDANVITRCDLNVVNEALGAISALDDLNQDGVVNVVDVQMVINAALGSVCEAR